MFFTCFLRSFSCLICDKTSINSNAMSVLISVLFLNPNRSVSTMGASSSTEEKKEIDATGTINNNIVLKNTDTFNVSTQFDTFVLVAVICGIKILELLFFIYFKHRRGLKKSYISKNSVP